MSLPLRLLPLCASSLLQLFVITVDEKRWLTVNTRFFSHDKTSSLVSRELAGSCFRFMVGWMWVVVRWLVKLHHPEHANTNPARIGSINAKRLKLSHLLRNRLLDCSALCCSLTISIELIGLVWLICLDERFLLNHHSLWFSGCRIDDLLCVSFIRRRHS